MNHKPKTNQTLLQHARSMRRQPTTAEQVLWQRLRRSQLGNYKFRRQQPLGQYIVDFYCHQTRLIIEIDGDVHAHQETYDAERTAWLEANGYRVVRFSNMDVVKNTDGVLQMILTLCDEAVGL